MKAACLIVLAVVMCGCQKPQTQSNVIHPDKEGTWGPQGTATSTMPCTPANNCTYATTTGTITGDVHKEPTWIAQLRAEAAKRRLRWTVECSHLNDDGDTPEEAYIARAHLFGSPKEHDNDIYIEDGAVPAWFAFGPNATVAARELLGAIQGPPNDVPEHRPVEKRKVPPNHQCQSPISGGDPSKPDQYATGGK